MQRFVVVLLRPDGLHAVLHPLGFENQLDTLVPRGPDAGFQIAVDPRIVGLSGEDLVPRREHAVDDAVVERHGVGVPAPPAPVGVLRREHVLHAPAGRIAVKGVLRQQVDVRKVFDLRIDVGVVERREAVARLEGGFHRVGVEPGQHVEVLGPAAVGILVSDDVVGDFTELVGLVTLVGLRAVLLVPMVHGIGETVGGNRLLRNRGNSHERYD